MSDDFYLLLQAPIFGYLKSPDAMWLLAHPAVTRVGRRPPYNYLLVYTGKTTRLRQICYVSHRYPTFQLVSY